MIAAPAAAQAQAIIDNDVVQLGVHPEAHLNVPGPPSAQGTSVVGVRFLPTNNEATGPGCACEGWGAADATSGVTGYANESEGGTTNIFPVSFVSDADSAVSVVEIGDPGVLRVTHDFHPSVVGNLYEVTVTIENISGAPIDARYRRVMDWDIEPTAFSEFVTVNTGDASQLLDNDNDGFATADPLGDDGNIDPMFTGDFEDEGPHDHGSRFDFGLGTIAPGGSETFDIYYGGASNENAAENAIFEVSGEVYSLGQPDTPNGPTLGTPNTFIFAFAGVGGDPIFPEPPDDYYEDTCGGREANRIEGDGGDNVLVGTNGRDLILGAAGDDTLRGRRAGDCLFGQRGADTIAGGRGSDLIGGGRGTDLLRGGKHGDTIRGGGLHDTLRGGTGRDKLNGGKGRDAIRGGLRRDTLKGGRGRDLLFGGRGHDTLRGGKANDRLKGGPGRDTLVCGKGGRDVAIADGQDTVHSSCEIVRFK